MNGIPNLERLFAKENIPKPEDMVDLIAEMDLQKYNSDLLKILSALSIEPDKGEFGTLVYAINEHWSKVALEDARKDRYEAGTKSGCNLETPYSSGFANAASLFINPTRYGFEREDAKRIWESTGLNWGFSDNPIGAQRNVLVDGKLVSDPLSALELYLDRIEQGIERDIACTNGEHQRFFYIAPDVGLSLIGFGDAVRKAGEGQKMETDYLQMALRAYASSGFKETTYVQRRRLGIGDISPAIYVMVKAGDLMQTVTPEQFKQLMTQ